jgi:hypothetical protein
VLANLTRGSASFAIGGTRGTKSGRGRGTRSRRAARAAIGGGGPVGARGGGEDEYDDDDDDDDGGRLILMAPVVGGVTHDPLKAHRQLELVWAAQRWQ